MVSVLQELTASPAFSPVSALSASCLPTASFFNPSGGRTGSHFQCPRVKDPTNKPIVTADLGPGATVPGS